MSHSCHTNTQVILEYCVTKIYEPCRLGFEPKYSYSYSWRIVPTTPVWPIILHFIPVFLGCLGRLYWFPFQTPPFTTFHMPTVYILTLNHLTFIPTYLPLSLYRSSKFLPVIQGFGRLLLFIYSFNYTVSFLKHYKTMFYRFLLIIILFYYTTPNVRNITIQ